MAILIRDPNYGATGEIDDAFQHMLEAEMRREFGDVRIDSVDAGPGASDPGYYLEVINLVASALAILGIAGLIKENLPLWKSGFDKLVSFFRQRELVYFIDSQTAQCLALHYVIQNIGVEDAAGIEVISAVRHGFNMAPSSGEVASPEVSPLDQSAIDAHYAAVGQMHCRFVICVATGINCYTVVIEGNGDCSFIKPIFN